MEKIFNYVYNIEAEDNWINNEGNVFDDDEIKVLNDLKLKFMQINEQAKLFEKINFKDRIVEG